MTLPSSRFIKINDRKYSYILKGGKGSLIGGSGASIRLIIDMGNNKYFTGVFLSKLWTDEHSENIDCAPPHKASFKPSDVRAVIEALDETKLPDGFELSFWKYVR